MNAIEEFDQQKTKVLKYILYKKRTEQEVRKKFSNTMDENMLEDVIAYLKEAQYIDDKEFVEKVVQEFTNLKNLSIKEITYKLYTKGINKNDIEDYLAENREELNQYEIKSAKNIIEKKSALMEEKEIQQYLLKKGYKMENIKEARDE